MGTTGFPDLENLRTLRDTVCTSRTVNILGTRIGITKKGFHQHKFFWTLERLSVTDLFSLTPRALTKTHIWRLKGGD